MNMNDNEEKALAELAGRLGCTVAAVRLRLDNAITALAGIGVPASDVADVIGGILAKTLSVAPAPAPVIEGATDAM